MSYASLWRIPHLVTYAQAKVKYETTKPVRGDEANRRPLGSRRDKHLHITEEVVNDETVYKCHCYNRPVVTFYPDNTVELSMGYRSAYADAYYNRLLSSLHVYVKQKRRVADIGGNKYVMTGDAPLKIKWSGIDWTVLEATAPMEWALNRAKANKVRAAYTDFLNYYKGMIRLLTEPIDVEVKYANRWWMRGQKAVPPFVATSEVRIPMQTMVDMFGKFKTGFANDMLNTEEPKKACFTYKARYGAPDQVERMNMKAKSEQLEVLSLMRNDQPEETKADNFYRAFLTLLVAQQTYTPTKAEFFTVTKASVEKKADEFVLRVHKEEVLEKKRIPVGRIASTDYANWFEFV